MLLPRFTRPSRKPVILIPKHSPISGSSAARFKGMEATVNLEEQRVTLNIEEEISFHFEIDPGVKEHLLRGLDEIGLTLEHDAAIKSFESKHDNQMSAQK